MNNSKRAELLKAIYDQLPAINCSGKCWHSCGPILQSKAEEKLITNIHGAFPHPDSTLTCNFLDSVSHQCKIYQHRPLICRAFGLTDSIYLKCDYGCAPSVQISQERLQRLFVAADNIEGGSTPRQRNLLMKALNDSRKAKDEIHNNDSE